jgi:hypothetical protein
MFCEIWQVWKEENREIYINEKPRDLLFVLFLSSQGLVGTRFKIRKLNWAFD